ncbi:MAG: MurR/RpiR family transcriptional regulator [Gammaproteobacteria bacterium]|nr:MurR/RpiR family transcriptional regulator [Gammaproteobacteria bacterium]
MSAVITPTPSAAPPEVLARLLESLPSLSPQLRKAARYVLDHPAEVGVSSISRLADAAGVKPNSLVRMARAVGYDGYEDFREPFRDMIRSGRQDFPDRARWLQSIARGGRHGELLTEMARDIFANTESLFAGITTDAVKVAADAIVEARVTYVLGVGVAYAVARNFAYLAGMALETVVAIPKDGSLPVDDLVRAGPGDVLLAMTFEPYRTEVVQAVDTARDQGVAIIAFTDSLASPIARDVAQVFCVPTVTAQFFTSTVALGALFETLMAFVVADAPDEVVASIERFHRHRHEIGVYWDEGH